MASAGVSKPGEAALDSCAVGAALDSCAEGAAPDSCAEGAAPDSCAAVEGLDSRAGLGPRGGRRSFTEARRGYLRRELWRARHPVTDPSFRVSRRDTSG